MLDIKEIISKVTKPGLGVSVWLGTSVLLVAVLKKLGEDATLMFCDDKGGAPYYFYVATKKWGQVRLSPEEGRVDDERLRGLVCEDKYEQELQPHVEKLAVQIADEIRNIRATKADPNKGTGASSPVENNNAEVPSGMKELAKDLFKKLSSRELDAYITSSNISKEEFDALDKETQELVKRAET